MVWTSVVFSIVWVTLFAVLYFMAEVRCFCAGGGRCVPSVVHPCHTSSFSSVWLLTWAHINFLSSLLTLDHPALVSHAVDKILPLRHPGRAGSP